MAATSRMNGCGPARLRCAARGLSFRTRSCPHRRGDQAQGGGVLRPPAASPCPAMVGAFSLEAAVPTMGSPSVSASSSICTFPYEWRTVWLNSTEYSGLGNVEAPAQLVADRVARTAAPRCLTNLSSRHGARSDSRGVHADAFPAFRGSSTPTSRARQARVAGAAGDGIAGLR